MLNLLSGNISGISRKKLKGLENMVATKPRFLGYFKVELGNSLCVGVNIEIFQ